MKTAGFKIKKKHGFRIDFTLLIAVLVLVAFGIVMVYSASYYQAELTYGDPQFFMKKYRIYLR